MANDKSISDTKSVERHAENKLKLAMEIDVPNKGEWILCKVCGHKNPRGTGLCEMCSNYLFK